MLPFSIDGSEAPFDDQKIFSKSLFRISSRKAAGVFFGSLLQYSVSVSVGPLKPNLFIEGVSGLGLVA